MNNNLLKNILKEREYVFKKPLFKIIKEFKLTKNEIILLIYFLNQDKPMLDTDNIKQTVCLEEKEILEAFTSLNSKGLVTIDLVKNKDNKLDEIINMDNLFKIMVSYVDEKFRDNTKDDIYETFEKEFGRTLSPMEFELIGAWINSGIEQELVLGALKEATYNGVSNLRYIDKIIYEWSKKGIKTSEDVEKNRKAFKNNSKKQELFDYDWLNETDSN